MMLYLSLAHIVHTYTTQKYIRYLTKDVHKDENPMCMFSLSIICEPLQIQRKMDGIFDVNFNSAMATNQIEPNKIKYSKC